MTVLHKFALVFALLFTGWVLEICKQVVVHARP